MRRTQGLLQARQELGFPPVEDVVGLLAKAWESIGELAASLDPDDWAKPTECPGWSVQDQLSHLAAPEAMMLGRPVHEHHAPPADHVRNALGASNEDAVDLRRAWSPGEVLAEFLEVTRARLAVLGGLGPDDLARPSWTPTGLGTMADLLAIRSFDAWVHEQDVRRATGRPGHLGGPVASHSLGRCFLAMPYVVGKKAAAPDGSQVHFRVTGPTDGELSVVVENGRARALARPRRRPGGRPGGPTSAAVSVGFEPYTRLCCGRWPPSRAREDPSTSLEGDEDLGGRVLDNLAFMI